MCKLKKYLYGTIVAGLVLCSSINVFAGGGDEVEEKEQKQQEQAPSSTPTKGDGNSGTKDPQCSQQAQFTNGAIDTETMDRVKEGFDIVQKTLDVGTVAGDIPDSTMPPSHKTDYITIRARSRVECDERTSKIKDEYQSSEDKAVVTCVIETIDGFDFVMNYLASEPHSITEEERSGEVEMPES